jgi:PAS domain S-box-containing protein
MSSDNLTVNTFQYLRDGGEMGKLIRAYDWSQNVLGHPETWPQSLLTTLSIMLNSRFPMFLWWGPDLIQFYNDAYRPSLGNNGKHPAAIGQRGEDCWPEIWPVIKPLIDQVMSGGPSTFNEDQLIPIYRNNRLEDVYWTFSYSRVNDESGHPGGVLVICSETTKQVQAHHELLNAKNELDFALDAAGLGTWDLDPATGKFVGNSRLKSWFGLKADREIDLSAAMEAVVPCDREHVRESIAAALNYKSGGDYDIEYSIINMETGAPRYIRAMGKAIFNSNKEAIRLSGIIQDITAEKIAKENLKESKQRLEMALDAANLGSYDLDFTTGNMICNAQYKANFGYPENAPFNLQLYIDAILPEYRLKVLALRDEAIANKALYHAKYPVKWPDGSIHWISVYGKPYYGRDGKAVRIIGISNDITRQVNAQKELERIYEQARLSKEAAQLGTFDIDLQNGTMEWDERCRALFGVSHTNPVNYEKDFLNGLHPDDKDRIRKTIENVYVKSISNGDYDVEYRTIGQDDKKLRWVRAKGKTYFDEQEKPLRFIGSVLDITEQKSDELRKNDFISMVSHELKTPLTSVKAYIQMLMEMELSQDEFMAQILKKADNQVRRMGALIDGFLSVSRLESGKLLLHKEHFNLNDLIEEIKSDASLIFSSHSIKTTHCENFVVNADKEKIGSVILNLLSNAVKYSHKNSNVHIDCSEHDDMVKISVHDEGIGIHEQDIKKLFDRFYRVENNKNRFISGFGIGLYLCAEIIQGHEGNIWAESTLDKGSVFHFTLPLLN